MRVANRCLIFKARTSTHTIDAHLACVYCRLNAFLWSAARHASRFAAHTSPALLFFFETPIVSLVTGLSKSNVIAVPFSGRGKGSVAVAILVMFM